MDKNLHDIDDIFNKVYQQYEDEPSEGVWEKLNAGLDKEDARKYKKRFIGWKRAAILLLFLLSGIILYESRLMLKSNGGKSISGKNNIPKHPSAFDKHTNTPDDSTTITHSTSKYTKQGDVTGIPDGTEAQKFTSTSLPALVFGNRGKASNKNVLKFDSLTVMAQADDNKGQLELQIKRPGKVEKEIITSEKNEEILSIISNNYRGNDSVLFKTTTDKRHSGKMLAFDSAVAIVIPKTESVDSNTISVATMPFPAPVITKSSVSKHDKSPSKQFKPYWVLTGYASLDRSEYNLNNDLPDNIASAQKKEEINNREKHELSFSAGVMATRQLTKHFGFKTGIIYSNTSISIDPQEMYATRKPDGTIGYKYITSSGYGYVKPKFGLPPALGDSLQSANAQHSLQSYGIPLQLLYKIDKRRFSIMPSVGLSINFISKATVQTQVKDAFNRETVMINGLNGMKKIYIGLMADINFQYNYNNRWSFNLLPTLRYAITPITQSNVVKTYPYSAGISAGITYKFFK